MSNYFDHLFMLQIEYRGLSVCRSVPYVCHTSEPCNKSSAVAEMGDCLAIVDMGRKLEGCMCPLFGSGELGPHLTQCRLGRNLPPYSVAS